MTWKKSRNPKRHDHQSITKSDCNHKLWVAMTKKTIPWDGPVGQYRGLHVPPFINGRGPTLYLFRCSTTSTQNNDTRPTHRKGRPVTGMLRGNRPRTEGFGLSENHGKNVGGTPWDLWFLFFGFLKRFCGCFV